MVKPGLQSLVVIRSISIRFIERGPGLRVQLLLLKMPLHSQQDGNANPHKRCSAQHQEHKQNLDHHRMSE